MKLVYKNWEPNKGYEEDQAKIYNTNNNGSTSGKDIVERYQREKIDPKTVRYVFDAKGKKPLRGPTEITTGSHSRYME